MTLNKIVDEYDKIIFTNDKLRDMIENSRAMVDELNHIPDNKLTKIYYNIDILMEMIDNCSNISEEIQNIMNKLSDTYGDENITDDGYDSENDDEEF